MTRTRTRLAIVGIALLVVVAAVPLPPGGGTAAAAEHSFVVTQGDRCVEVSPLRGGEDAASFYDYRTLGNTPRSAYSSYMPDAFTAEDASRLFLYDGPRGVSLVIVHNTNGGDVSDGSAATFRFRGLPSSGEWVVVDDTYPGQDDRVSRTRIDWTWYGDRTDGGVFRGLDREGTEVTISPAFDERAALYDRYGQSGDVRSWQLLTGSIGAPSAVGLDPTRPVTIRTGTCGPDETPPSAALSASDGVVGQPVALDASGSTDGSGIAAYRWDFDGDGEVDRTTADPTVAHEYAEAATYDATVTVVDGAGNTDTARAEIAVSTDDPPSAEFRVGDSPTEGFPVSFDASEATDDLGIAAYRWDFDGDGAVERTTDEPTVTRTYEDAGSYDVRLTVADGGGQNDTATRTISVGADDPPDPAVRVVSPETPVVGQQVVLDAGDSTDDTGVRAYRWSFGDGATATGERVVRTFEESGTVSVTLEVEDEGGNTATETLRFEVRPPDETPPDAAVAADPATVAAGTAVAFDASESSDARGVAAYRWDFDGDGAVERTTDEPTVSREYASPGTYDATVTAVDAGGNAASANVTVRVHRPDDAPPSAALSVGTNRTEAGSPVAFDAGDSTDATTAVAEYRWDFDGDGAVERTTDEPTVRHAYDSAGRYNATVTAVDLAGNVDEATVAVRVERNEQAHGGGGGGSGGGGGTVSFGPPPVVTETEKHGPNARAVDVRNGRSGETVRATLPATAAAEESAVRFRTLAVDLATDDPHFVVETERSGPAAETGGSPPADVTLGSLSVGARYVRSGQVERVTHEVAIERSRLADAGVAATDLSAYRYSDGAWEETNATVVSGGETVVLRVETGGFVPVAVGAERSVTVTDAALAASEVAADEPVSVTATVRNEAGAAETFTANLTADGEVVATETVEVPAGETAAVTVETRLAPGSHAIGLDGTAVGNVTVAEPAPEVVVADASLNRSTIGVGERVAVTATVENRGSADGERTVALTMFGQRVATETVNLSAGETATVTFVRRVDAAGNYTAAVGNASAALTVEERADGPTRSTPDVPIPGFGAGAAVAALVAALLVARKRR